MGNCCESETAAEVVTAAVAEAEELGFEEPVVAEARHFSNPASDAGATETKVSQPVSVVPELKKDTPTGYMSSEYLATVSAIGKGAYLMYDALQGGKFEIHYRAEPPKEGTIEKKIVLFGEFVEGVTSIADRRFRRNETEVTKTHITVSSWSEFDAAKPHVCLSRHCRVRHALFAATHAAEDGHGRQRLTSRLQTIPSPGRFESEANPTRGTHYRPQQGPLHPCCRAAIQKHTAGGLGQLQPDGPEESRTAGWRRVSIGGRLSCIACIVTPRFLSPQVIVSNRLSVAT